LPVKRLKPRTSPASFQDHYTLPTGDEEGYIRGYTGDETRGREEENEGVERTRVALSLQKGCLVMRAIATSPNALRPSSLAISN